VSQYKNVQDSSGFLETKNWKVNILLMMISHKPFLNNLWDDSASGGVLNPKLRNNYQWV